MKRLILPSFVLGVSVAVVLIGFVDDLDGSDANRLFDVDATTNETTTGPRRASSRETNGKTSDDTGVDKNIAESIDTCVEQDNRPADPIETRDDADSANDNGSTPRRLVLEGEVVVAANLAEDEDEDDEDEEDEDPTYRPIAEAVLSIQARCDDVLFHIGETTTDTNGRFAASFRLPAVFDTSSEIVITAVRDTVGVAQITASADIELEVVGDAWHHIEMTYADDIFRIELDPADAFIDGTVHGLDGPAVNAFVIVVEHETDQYSRFRTTTDDTGRYRIAVDVDESPPGAERWVVCHDPRQGYARRAIVPRPRKTAFDVVRADLVLNRCRRVSGRFLTWSGNPAPGVEVNLRRIDQDDLGLTPKPRRQTQTRRRQTRDDASPNIEPNPDDIPRAPVPLGMTSARTTTDADGRFTVHGLAPIAFEVWTNFDDFTDDVIVPADAESAPTVRLAARRVDVVLLDAARRPVTDAVAITYRGGIGGLRSAPRVKFETDEQGRGVGVVAKGSGPDIVYAPGRPHVVPHAVPRGADDHTVVLVDDEPSAATLVLDVRDADGTPTTAYRAAVLSKATSWHIGSADVDGRSPFRLPPSRYRIDLAARHDTAGDISVSKFFVPFTIEIDLPSACIVERTVSFEQGARLVVDLTAKKVLASLSRRTQRVIAWHAVQPLLDDVENDRRVPLMFKKFGRGGSPETPDVKFGRTGTTLHAVPVGRYHLVIKRGRRVLWRSNEITLTAATTTRIRPDVAVIADDLCRHGNLGRIRKKVLR